MSRLLGLVVFALALLSAQVARASLEEDARAVEGAMARSSATLVHSDTVFLEEGQILALPRIEAPHCRAVVVVASRTVRFFVITGTAAESVDDLILELAVETSTRRIMSESGLVQLGGCDAEARTTDKILVQMLSPRGAVELRGARGDAVLPDVLELLGRSAGPPAPRGDPGPPLPVTSLVDRRQRGEASARADGATNVLVSETKSSPTGNGELSLKVGAGCHRFRLMAEAIEGHAVMDVDAELRDGTSGAPLARDRGETPDARLEACFSRTTEIVIVFGGAPPSTRLVVQDALFPVPGGVPEHYGDRARAALAKALRRRVRSGPANAPIFETLGAQGSVSTGVNVELGRCYLAAVAVMRGAARGMRLSAQAGSRASIEEVGSAQDAAVVHFCADSTSTARLAIDVPGAAVGWVAMVWPLGDPR